MKWKEHMPKKIEPIKNKFLYPHSPGDKVKILIRRILGICEAGSKFY